MKKKILALLLALCMLAGLLAGCGSSEEPSGTNPGGGGGESPPAGGGGEDNPGGGNDDPGELVEIVVGCMSFAPVDDAVQTRIENKVNEYMEELINVRADFIWFDASSYGTQIPLMIQGGDQLDAIMYTPIPVASFTSFTGQGQFMDIAPYIDQYGPDIKAVLGEAGLAATTKNGKLLGVGGMMSNASQYAIVMRTDVLEDIGRLDDFNNMKTWSEFEDILKDAVAAGYPGIANGDAEGTVFTTLPFLTGEENFADSTWIDFGGDGYQHTYIDPATDQFVCLYEAPRYKEALLRAGRFYEEGLVYKDAATAMDYAATQVKNGVGSCYTNQIDFGGEPAQNANCGYTMSFKYLENSDSQVATGTFNKFGWGVPVTSKEPEAAVKFLTLLYTENKVHETLTWGEEGVDWVRNADGTGTYPNGGDSAEYHMSDFMYGNILTVCPWEGEGADLRERQAAANAAMKTSKYVGFAVNTDPVMSEITAVQNVKTTYKPMLASGAYGAQTEAKYEEFIDALYAAGMQKILDEFNSQLSAWLAEQ